MRFSIRWLLLFLLVVSIVLMFIAERYRPVRIAVGMDRETVLQRLVELGAVDYSKNRQVYFVHVDDDGRAHQVPPPVEDGPIWNIYKQGELTVETRYENDLLSEIKLWDWRGRDPDIWLKSGPDLFEVEHDVVSEFQVSRIGNDFSYETIKTINAGVLPPKKEGDD